MESLTEITNEYIDSLKFVKEVINRDIELPISSDIVAIVGARRVGKSFLMLSKARDLLGEGKNVLYLPFDEPFLKNIEVRKLAELLRKEYPEGKIYLFLDEVQEWKYWDRKLRWLHDVKDFYIYVSGSSSTLQSSEIPSRLRGRYISKLLLPFSFKEVADGDLKTFRERGKVERLFENYLRWGGFPEIWLYRSREKINSILQTIFYRDIIERYRIINREEFSSIFYFLISNFSNKFTWNSLRRILMDQSIKVDTKTLINYINYLKNSFLIFTVSKFSHSEKEKIRAPKKIYLVDLSFINLFEKPYEIGRKMENLVFLELLRRSYEGFREIFYYITRDGREVDFIIKKGGRIEEIIEVAYEVDLTHKEKIVSASTELKCKNLLIITWDVEDTVKYQGMLIKLIPLWKWLLKRK